MSQDTLDREISILYSKRNLFRQMGGETSGAVVQALNVRTLHIGRQIDPGVPATMTTGDVPLGLALKSGNFGATDFFAKALRHLDKGSE